MVKLGGDNVIQNIKGKFKELRVEGYRKDFSSASMMYTEDMDEDLPEEHSTEKELETMYMGTESEARKRFQRQGSFRRRESFGQRYTSRLRSGSFVQ